MSDIGTTPRTLTSDSAASSLPSSVNVQEQNSLVSGLTTVGTVSTVASNVQEQNSLTSDLSTVGTVSTVASNVQEQNSLTSDLTTTIGTATTAALTSLHSENEDQSTSAPIGVFHSTLQNAGLDNLALHLGNDFLNHVEGSVQVVAQLLFLDRTAGNAHVLSNRMASYVQIIQARIESLQLVNAGWNESNLVIIENEIVEIAINEAIDRMQN
jgi:hypothetical protein